MLKLWVVSAASRCTEMATVLAAMRSQDELLAQLAVAILGWKIRRGEAEAVMAGSGHDVARQAR